MSRKRVQAYRLPNNSYEIETDATIGAQLGVNLFDEDGDVLSLAQLVALAAGAVDQGGVKNSTWDLVLDKPANVVALGEATGNGIFVILSDGSGAFRAVSVAPGTAPAASIADGDGDGGDPTLSLDATLVALAQQNWAANAVPVGTGPDALTQLALAVNTFLGRSSTGNVAAKAITDGAFSVLAGTAGQSMFLRGDGTATATLLFDGATGTIIQQNYANNAAANQYRGEKARGTLASPTAAQALDGLVSIQGRAWFSGGTPGFSGNIGDVFIRMTEAATNTAQGTEVLLRATPIGSTTIGTVFTANPVGVTAPFGEYQTGVLSPAQITADQNDYAPTGHGTVRTLRLNTDASRNLTGLAGGSAGRCLRIVNNGVNNLVLVHNSGSSTAGNRFLCPNAANVTIPQGGSVALWYDGSSAAWRVQGI